MYFGKLTIYSRLINGSEEPIISSQDFWSVQSSQLLTYFEIDQIGCPNITLPNFHLHMQYTMHKGTNTIYYKKGKQKGFFIELHKKVGYRSFFSVGMSEHNLSTTYLTACWVVVCTRKKYEKNFFFYFLQSHSQVGEKLGSKSQVS